MKAIGKIVSVENNKAIVETQRNSACSSCDNCKGKDACHAHLIFGDNTRKVTLEVDNSIGAFPGNTVELESDTTKTLVISMAIFLIPVLVCFADYCLVSAFIDNAFVIFLSVLLSAFLSFALLTKLMNRYVKKKVSINIVKILEESDE